MAIDRRNARFAQQAFVFPHEDTAIARALDTYAKAYPVTRTGLDYLARLDIDPTGAYGLPYSHAGRGPQVKNWVSNPTLVGLFSHIVTGQPRGIMAVRIPGAGYSREVRFSGRIKDTVIRLDRLTGPRLIIAESLETALKARHAGAPVWCGGSSSARWRLQPILGVEELTIITSGNRALERAVEALSDEWAESGRVLLHKVSDFR